MRYIDSPVVRILVRRPTVDTIEIFSKADWGWKVQGWKERAVSIPDQWQDNFDAVITDIADYVDNSSVWTIAESGEEITAWQATKILTVGGVAE